jgi:hypothetical protein
VETVEHLLFGCFLAKMVWAMLTEIFHLDWFPSSLDDLSCVWLQGKGPLPGRLTIFVFAACSWSLWTVRNKMAIEHTFPKAPVDVMYAAVSLMQRWSLLLKEQDEERMDQVVGNILSWLKAFQPNPILQSDVAEI